MLMDRYEAILKNVSLGVISLGGGFDDLANGSLSSWKMRSEV